MKELFDTKLSGAAQLGLKPRRLHGAYSWLGSESPTDPSAL